MHDVDVNEGGGAPLLPLTRLKAERVQDAVRSLPGWEVMRDGAAIRRLFRVPGRARAQFLDFAGALAARSASELAFVPSAEGLECRLTTPAAGGVTAQDLELAKEMSLLG